MDAWMPPVWFLTPAASSWIPVDSGVRPEHGQLVMVVEEDGRVMTVTYEEPSDLGCINTYGAIPMSNFTHWARVYTPKTRLVLWSMWLPRKRVGGLVIPWKTYLFSYVLDSEGTWIRVAGFEVFWRKV